MKKDMLKKNYIDKNIVEHIAELAKLKLDVNESNYLTKQFNETIEVIDKINILDTKNVPETSQTTGLINIYREDKIIKKRILSQKEALSNSKRTYKGFFVVKAIFNDK